MHIAAETLDDLLRQIIPKLLKIKKSIRTSRGNVTELIGVLLQLDNPRARLSLTETKGRVSSCLGELLWYLAKTKDLKFITYYLPRYEKESEDGRTIYGAYGPRLFKMKGKDQVDNVLALLKKRRNSRRAVIQLFDAADIAKEHEEIPCTCTLQFMIRDRCLYMFTYMRSNDVFIGLPHDIFAFTMLQEIFARTLGVGIGKYYHAVGNLHLYKRDRKNARQYLKEGWQSMAPMPSMPATDPWSSIHKLLNAEHMIRSGRTVRLRDLHLRPYWADLVRLLQIYWHFKEKEDIQIIQLKRKMSNRVYDSYIEDLRNRLQKKSNRKRRSG